MAYYNGSAASFADLKTAIENACVAEGWVIADGILSISTCYVLMESSLEALTLTGGNGQSGSTLLDPPADASNRSVKLVDTAGTPISWPVSYEIHIFSNPNEVYCIVNYNSDFYMQLSFGQSNIPGIGGTGNWFTGQFPQRTDVNSVYANKAYVNFSYSDWHFFGFEGSVAGGLFADKFAPSTRHISSFLHCGLDSVEWLDEIGGLITGERLGPEWCSSLMAASPSPANSATVLIPVKCIKPRSSGGLTIVANLHNARYLRIDNIVPGDIITYGSDQWKVYPFMRKDASERNGVTWPTGATHSGTLGYAIKYTGV